MWNASGVRPAACDFLEEIARKDNPTARVWRGSGVPTEQQGMKILGTPMGHPDFVQRHLVELAEEQRVFLERIPRVKDVQGAWLLLAHCASARANYFLRAVKPEAVAEYARRHDAGLRECLSRILQVDLSTCGQDTHDVATLPLVLRGLGVSAYWASWADCMPSWALRGFVGRPPRHPIPQWSSGCSQKSPWGHGIRTTIVGCCGDRRQTRATRTRRSRAGGVRAGWQHEAASRVERHFRDVQVFPQMVDARKALIRSQADLVQDCLSRVAQPSPWRRSVLSSSGCCSFGAFACLSLLPRVLAGVAVHLILVATTVLRAECDGEDLPRGRGPSHDQHHDPWSWSGASTRPWRKTSRDCGTPGQLQTAAWGMVSTSETWARKTASSSGTSWSTCSWLSGTSLSWPNPRQQVLPRTSGRAPCQPCQWRDSKTTSQWQGRRRWMPEMCRPGSSDTPGNDRRCGVLRDAQSQRGTTNSNRPLVWGCLRSRSTSFLRRIRTDALVMSGGVVMRPQPGPSEEGRWVHLWRKRNALQRWQTGAAHNDRGFEEEPAVLEGNGETMSIDERPGRRTWILPHVLMARPSCAFPVSWDSQPWMRFKERHWRLVQGGTCGSRRKRRDNEHRRTRGATWPNSMQLVLGVIMRFQQTIL